MSEKKCSKPLCGKASPADANKKIVADFMAPASATRTRMCRSHPLFFAAKSLGRLSFPKKYLENRMLCLSLPQKSEYARNFIFHDTKSYSSAHAG